jgi:hypothetical protein
MRQGEASSAKDYVYGIECVCGVPFLSLSCHSPQTQQAVGFSCFWLGKVLLAMNKHVYVKCSMCLRVLYFSLLFFLTLLFSLFFLYWVRSACDDNKIYGWKKFRVKIKRKRKHKSSLNELWRTLKAFKGKFMFRNEEKVFLERNIVRSHESSVRCFKAWIWKTYLVFEKILIVFILLKLKLLY